MSLVMFSKVGLLSKTFTTKSAAKRLFTSMRPDMYINRVPVFETLVAYWAIM